jgi:hypothetical protein
VNGTSDVTVLVNAQLSGGFSGQPTDPDPSAPVNPFSARGRRSSRRLNAWQRQGRALTQAPQRAAAAPAGKSSVRVSRWGGGDTASSTDGGAASGSGSAGHDAPKGEGQGQGSGAFLPAGPPAGAGAAPLPYTSADAQTVNGQAVNATSASDGVSAAAALPAQPPGNGTAGGAPGSPPSRRLVCWAWSQLSYLLGRNPANLSYLIGYEPAAATTAASAVGIVPPPPPGSAPWPLRPRHRAASCDPDPSVPCNWSAYTAQQPNPITLLGALVAGPDAADGYVDRRSNFRQADVSVLYDASLVGALAALAGAQQRLAAVGGCGDGNGTAVGGGSGAASGALPGFDWAGYCAGGSGCAAQGGGNGSSNTSNSISGGGTGGGGGGGGGGGDGDGTLGGVDGTGGAGGLSPQPSPSPSPPPSPQPSPYPASPSPIPEPGHSTIPSPNPNQPQPTPTPSPSRSPNLGPGPVPCPSPSHPQPSQPSHPSQPSPSPRPSPSASPSPTAGASGSGSGGPGPSGGSGGGGSGADTEGGGGSGGDCPRAPASAAAACAPHDDACAACEGHPLAKQRPAPCRACVARCGPSSVPCGPAGTALCGHGHIMSSEGLQVCLTYIHVYSTDSVFRYESRGTPGVSLVCPVCARARRGALGRRSGRAVGAGSGL